MKKLIKVTGKGKITRTPDLMRLTVTLGGIEKSYADAVRLSEAKTKTVTGCFTDNGIAKDELKTVGFNISAKYESVYENGKSRREFRGYELEHRLTVSFGFDNERLGKILFALSECGADPEFDLSYALSEPEKAKNELIASAVRDSAEKAKTLTEAAGVKLGTLVNINYSWADDDFGQRPMGRMMLCKNSFDGSAGADFGITPDDIVLEDSVTVIWEIE